MDRLNRDEPWYAPVVSRQISGVLRKKAERAHVRLFVGVAAGGRPVGIIGLAVQDGVAAILSVGTFPEERRRGHGRALVLATVAAARATGADLVYLVARADDWPRRLYADLGFRVELAFDVWLRS
jgi:ribosomal protein S18 acetylase RimI-like enzyme